MVNKILRALDDFRVRNLSVTQDKVSHFSACEEVSKKLADYTRAVGEKICDMLFSEKNTDKDDGLLEIKEPGWVELQNTMFQTTEAVLLVVENDVFGAVTKELRNLMNMLVELGSIASDVDMTAECRVSLSPLPCTRC
jgi:dynactin 1